MAIDEMLRRAEECRELAGRARYLGTMIMLLETAKAWGNLARQRELSGLDAANAIIADAAEGQAKPVSRLASNLADA